MTQCPSGESPNLLVVVLTRICVLPGLQDLVEDSEL